MKDSAQLFGALSPEAHKFAVDIFNFEKRIAEITPGIDHLNNPIKVNNKMKVNTGGLLFLMDHVNSRKNSELRFSQLVSESRKKNLPLMAGPLRGGGVKAGPLRKK